MTSRYESDVIMGATLLTCKNWFDKMIFCFEIFLICQQIMSPEQQPQEQTTYFTILQNTTTTTTTSTLTTIVQKSWQLNFGFVLYFVSKNKNCVLKYVFFCLKLRQYPITHFLCERESEREGESEGESDRVRIIEREW